MVNLFILVKYGKENLKQSLQYKDPHKRDYNLGL